MQISQQKQKRKVIILFPIFCFFSIVYTNFSAEQINSKNWRQNEQIKEIRKIFNEVERLQKAGNLIEERPILLHDPEAIINLYYNQNTSWVRKLKLEYKDSKNNNWTIKYYYDLNPGFHKYDSMANKLRFIFAQVESSRKSKNEYRLYFDENGSIIWEDISFKSGKNNFLPRKLPDELKQDQRGELHNQERVQAGE